jgi:hypothetical protein
MKFHQLQQLRKDHLLNIHDVVLYPYQEDISNRILAALLHNLNATTEQDVSELELYELSIEISRQAGKTTCVVYTVAIIMTYIAELYNRPISIGIFAPQIEQARTDFERLKNALRPIKDLMIKDDETSKDVKERENAKTLVLPNGSSCFIAPVTTTSKPESKTFDIMIFEEAQDLDDKIVQQQIWPIGATTNAPRIYIGTAGTRLCYFRGLGLTSRSIKIYFDEIAKQRKQIYDQTGDIKHLMYEQTVRNEILNAQEGLESDEIQRPYFGKWLIGTGQFTTLEELRELETERKYTQAESHMECFAGIDTAKHPDSTVVTIIRWNKTLGKKEIINWLELRGENYKNQYEIIMDFIGRYNIVALAIDSTGQGQFMPDWIKEESEFSDEHSGLYEIKFSQSSKDAMYRNLKVTIKEFLTTLPNLGTTSGKRFTEQMVNLQQQYKGQYLSVSHPDDEKAHDDYSDSWALAEWAFARWNETSNATIAVIDASQKERKATKNDEGKITDYWPGATW